MGEVIFNILVACGVAALLIASILVLIIIFSMKKIKEIETGKLHRR
jgi:hypothetical protein